MVDEIEDGSELVARAVAALKAASGSDFSDFRETTLRRRLSRRMALLADASMTDYVDLLERDSAEANELFRDILIAVTGFFREPEAFEALSLLAFPQIIARAEPGPVRLWVPGCSTGEEPYSLAIALLEAQEEARRERPVQIFATDINDAQIAVARAGTYPADKVGGLSEGRLERFFDKTPGGWKVGKKSGRLSSSHTTTSRETLPSRTSI